MHICVSSGTVSDRAVCPSGCDVYKTEMNRESNSHYTVSRDLSIISRIFLQLACSTFRLSLESRLTGLYAIKFVSEPQFSRRESEDRSDPTSL